MEGAACSFLLALPKYRHWLVCSRNVIHLYAFPSALRSQVLTSVASTAVHSHMFEDPDTLAAICERVVVPNIYARDQVCGCLW